MTRKLTFLVVDDDPGVRQVLRQMLRASGYSVREAADGQEALDRFSTARPDAVVLDVVLPGVGGLEVLERLRQSDGGVSVPVIAITGGIIPDTILLQKGASGVLRKPFSLRELQQAIDAAGSRTPTT